MDTFTRPERPSIISITNRLLSLRADAIRLRIESNLVLSPSKANAKQHRVELENLKKWVAQEQVFLFMTGHEQNRFVKCSVAIISRCK